MPVLTCRRRKGGLSLAKSYFGTSEERESPTKVTGRCVNYGLRFTEVLPQRARHS